MLTRSSPGSGRSERRRHDWSLVFLEGGRVLETSWLATSPSQGLSRHVRTQKRRSASKVAASRVGVLSPSTPAPWAMLQALFNFARARALQAPVIFVSSSLFVAWYGVYDLSYITTCTVIRHQPRDQRKHCRYGGHLIGVGAALGFLSLRFPRRAFFEAVSKGSVSALPWSAAAASIGASGATGGFAASCVQRSCAAATRSAASQTGADPALEA